ncbi:MAG: septum formation inhibitor Maf [Subtercola sp.]|nr:septum formation inhibitor Maf [Subtercola sp.]
MRLYLASTSPARLALLRQISIEPTIVPSFVDEDAAVVAAEAANGPLSAPELVCLLARLKAEAVLEALPGGERIDGFILGGDSAFEFDGAIYGKPHLPDVARERWQRYRGRSGVLHSGHWMIDHRIADSPFPAVGAVTSARVEFAADISDAEIDSYVASGEPLEVAGAFTIDGLAAPFISSITGAPSTVIGMSLPTLRDLAVRLGVTVGDFRA